jgi:predicted dehydrogenase
LGVIVDADGDAAERLASAHWARASTVLDDAFGADAAVVAVSSAAHLSVAIPLLEHGIPTFVEKPLACEVADVDEILATAERLDVPVMCGFVERFNAAYRTGAALVEDTPTHVLTIRHSPPAPRIMTSVVTDLLLHDLDLVGRLFGDEVPTVAGFGLHRPREAAYDEIADCQLVFPSGVATLSADRMTQLKVRSITIHCERQSIDIDLLRQNVTVYRNASHEMVQDDRRSAYRSATVVDIPFIRHSGEPLALQLEHFVDLVRGVGDHDLERESIRPAHRLIAEIEKAG